MPFIPHTAAQTTAMLKVVNKSMAELFAEIPANLRIDELVNIPPGINECTLLQHMHQRAQENHPGLNFLGAGAYEHHIPASVWAIATRGEFLTAYTPYQAEVSQGMLQLLYEYQTMMARLTGMAVSNASLYDGASALAEAVLMAVRLKGKHAVKKILLPNTVNPRYRETVISIVSEQNITIVDGEPYDALVIQQPNYFGCLEDIDNLTNSAHRHGALVIACVNPISLGLLREPGAWGEQGADIVCGEGQPLGVPLANGGPYFGFMTTRREYIRQLPGRIVGKTQDSAGNPGYTLTLQAREQHIRRGKATSNICTNQGLLVTAATIYLSLMGPALKQVASACHTRMRQLAQGLLTIPGIKLVYDAPYFHEACFEFVKPIAGFLDYMATVPIFAGVPIQQNQLLICATETKTVADIDLYLEHARKYCAT